MADEQSYLSVTLSTLGLPNSPRKSCHLLPLGLVLAQSPYLLAHLGLLEVTLMVPKIRDTGVHFPHVEACDHACSFLFFFDISSISTAGGSLTNSGISSSFLF